MTTLAQPLATALVSTLLLASLSRPGPAANREDATVVYRYPEASATTQAIEHDYARGDYQREADGPAGSQTTASDDPP